jgi:hypothetical protein
MTYNDQMPGDKKNEPVAFENNLHQSGRKTLIACRWKLNELWATRRAIENSRQRPREMQIKP